MAKRIDWDSAQRKQRANRNGSAYAYDELPPVGSYADQARYYPDNQDVKKGNSNQYSYTQKRKRRHGAMRTPEERINNIRKVIDQLVTIPNTQKWITRGPEYQQRILAQLAQTLHAFLKRDPSVISDKSVLNAQHILSKYNFNK